MNKYVQAAIIFVVFVLIGTAAGYFFSWAAWQAGTSSDMVFLANIVPAFLIGLVGGIVAGMKATS